jgi:5-methylcytosine-specific restriction enzyme A
MCARQGRIAVASVADHITPHRGDETAFWTGALQSLCATHHSRSKQLEERSTAPGVDADGWRLDRT